MSKSAALQPSINTAVTKYLRASSEAVSESCTGGNNQTCGQKWYTGSYDGDTGVGQQMSALETVQSLLLLDGSATRTIPRTDANVKIQVVPNRSEFPLTLPKETSAPSASSAPSLTASGSGMRSSSAASSANFLNRGSLKLCFAFMCILTVAELGNGLDKTTVLTQ